MKAQLVNSLLEGMLLVVVSRTRFPVWVGLIPKVCSPSGHTQLLQVVQPAMWMVPRGVGGGREMGWAVPFNFRKRKREGAQSSWRTCLELSGSCLGILVDLHRFLQTFWVLASPPLSFLSLLFLLFLWGAQNSWAPLTLYPYLGPRSTSQIIFRLVFSCPLLLLTLASDLPGCQLLGVRKSV